jgi:hypothetical protein
MSALLFDVRLILWFLYKKQATSLGSAMMTYEYKGLLSYAASEKLRVTAASHLITNPAYQSRISGNLDKRPGW